MTIQCAPPRRVRPQGALPTGFRSRSIGTQMSYIGAHGGGRFVAPRAQAVSSPSHPSPGWAGSRGSWASEPAAAADIAGGLAILRAAALPPLPAALPVAAAGTPTAVAVGRSSAAPRLPLGPSGQRPKPARPAQVLPARRRAGGRRTRDSSKAPRLAVQLDGEGQVVWTEELQRRMLEAVEHAGGLATAQALQVLRLMDVEGMTGRQLRFRLEEMRSQLGLPRRPRRKSDSGGGGRAQPEPNRQATSGGVAAAALRRRQRQDLDERFAAAVAELGGPWDASPTALFTALSPFFSDLCPHHINYRLKKMRDASEGDAQRQPPPPPPRRRAAAAEQARASSAAAARARSATVQAAAAADIKGAGPGSADGLRALTQMAEACEAVLLRLEEHRWWYDQQRPDVTARYHQALTEARLALFNAWHAAFGADVAAARLTALSAAVPPAPDHAPLDPPSVDLPVLDVPSLQLSHLFDETLDEPLPESPAFATATRGGDNAHAGLSSGGWDGAVSRLVTVN